ncbi:small heat shock protein [Daedalea quercina L-15889]|uniref:Small heat shock protein n=1 Tax=Daedalea quercina L-15889 TaxID=1314783 RepID=A0A165MW78_9APHY|nr:small heat shock protein [Daedalea quercina L-15889]
MALNTFFTEPFYSLTDFDRLFDEAFNARTDRSLHNGRQLQQRDGSLRSLRPRMDLHEDTQQNLVTATFELPGISKENVSVDVHNGVLTVSGQSKVEENRNQNGYAVRERQFGQFSRSIPLPKELKEENIRASMENGLLTVTFPKTITDGAPKKITIS